MENIAYYKVNWTADDSTKYKDRITYYFDDGRPHRYTESDTSGRVLTDFFYTYNAAKVRTGARYREPGELDYSVERLVYSDDSSQITTEWLDSIGRVYYQMVETYEHPDRLLHAAFIGDELHGYDTVQYHPSGMVSRIFFSNVRGTVFNDRSFEYPAINAQGDWTVRHQLTSDTLREVHVRTISYGNDLLPEPSPFYPVTISSSAQNENKISFNQDGSMALFTRGAEWTEQRAFLSQKKEGIFVDPMEIEVLGTLYNASLSPSGKRILFCRRGPSGLEVGISEMINNQWTVPQNIEEPVGLEAGYFHWYSEDELYFYVPSGNGDLMHGRLTDNSIIILDTLDVLNTPEATEFSPYVFPGKTFLMFSRYMEGDENNQGLFISRNAGSEASPDWQVPVKVESLPYGWGVTVLPESTLLLLSDGVDIRHFSLSLLAPYGIM